MLQMLHLKQRSKCCFMFLLLHHPLGGEADEAAVSSEYQKNCPSKNKGLRGDRGFVAATKSFSIEGIGHGESVSVVSAQVHPNTGSLAHRYERVSSELARVGRFGLECYDKNKPCYKTAT
jgi:hypothetical protein